MSLIAGGPIGSVVVGAATVAAVAVGVVAPRAAAQEVVLADPPVVVVDPAASGERPTPPGLVRDFIVTFDDPDLQADGRDTGRGVRAQALVDPDDLVRHDGVVGVHPAGPGHAVLRAVVPEAALERLPGIAEVEPDQPRYLSQSLYDRQWPLHNIATPGADIRYEEARELATGAGVVVAVIDSGVDTTHPDLGGQIWFNRGESCGNGVDDDGNGYIDDCNGWDFANNDATVNDAGADNSHGTHVSGIIAADDDGEGVTGVAGGAEIMSLKIFHNGGSSSALLAAAINYAVDNGADVINMSLGGSSGTNMEYQALQRANAAGIAVIAAAGNDSKNNDHSPTYPANYDLPVIVSVSSSNSTDQHSSRFSNYGRTTVDLHAPGEEILSTLPGSRAGYMSGTSMATPYASGVAALVVSQGVRGADVRRVLLDTAKPLPQLAGLTVTGARLDAAAAAGAGRDIGRDPVIGFESVHDGRAGEADTAAVRVNADLDAMELTQLQLRGTLGAVHGGELFAVMDFPLQASGREVTTGEAGEFALTGEALTADDDDPLRGDGVVVPLEWTLPAGDYALMVEALDAEDPAAGAVVDPSVVFFRVAAPPAPQPPADGTDEPVPDTPDQPDSDAPTSPTPPDGGDTTDDQPAPPSDGDTQTPPPPGGGGPGIVLGPGDGDGPDSGDSGGDSGGDGGSGTGGGTTSPSPDQGDGSTTPAPIPDEGDSGGGDSGEGAQQPPPTGGGTPPAPDQGEGGTTSPDPGDSPDGQVVQGSVSPSSGTPTQYLVLVSVPSGIPSGAYVHFDGVNAQVVARLGATAVVVQPPPHVAGTVDVTIVSGDQRLVLPRAYTYLNADGSSTPPPPPPADDGGEPGTPDDPTFDEPEPDQPTSPDQPSPDQPAPDEPSPGQPTPDDPAPGQPGDGSSPIDPDEPTPGEPEPPSEPDGPFQVNGLWLNRFPEGHPLRSVGASRVTSQLCTQDACPGRRP